MCMIFYRRDTHVAEIQMGKPATRVEDACAPDHFDPNKMSYVTLLGKCLLFYVAFQRRSSRSSSAASVGKYSLHNLSIYPIMDQFGIQNV